MGFFGGQLWAYLQRMSILGIVHDWPTAKIGAGKTGYRPNPNLERPFSDEVMICSNFGLAVDDPQNRYPIQGELPPRHTHSRLQEFGEAIPVMKQDGSTIEMSGDLST